MVLSPALTASALDDELVIGRMRKALEPLSPDRLDDEVERLYAYADAKIPVAAAARFDFAARRVELIRRQVMGLLPPQQAARSAALREAHP